MPKLAIFARLAYAEHIDTTAIATERKSLQRKPARQRGGERASGNNKLSKWKPIVFNTLLGESVRVHANACVYMRVCMFAEPTIGAKLQSHKKNQVKSSIIRTSDNHGAATAQCDAAQIKRPKSLAIVRRCRATLPPIAVLCGKVQCYWGGCIFCSDQLH